jgi:hypothetical protein
MTKHRPVLRGVKVSSVTTCALRMAVREVRENYRTWMKSILGGARNCSGRGNLQSRFCHETREERFFAGLSARFLKDYTGDFHPVPANSGFFQMSYVAENRREPFELGVWELGDTTDWREVALRFEEDILKDLDSPANLSPMEIHESPSQRGGAR